jgi:hypothetical protein
MCESGVCVCGGGGVVCVCVCVCVCTPLKSVTTIEKIGSGGTELGVGPGRLFWIEVRDGRREGAGANGRRTAVEMVSGFYRICQHFLMAVCPSIV